MLKTLRALVAGLAIALPALPVHAETWEYYFGSAWGDTTFQPANSFAYLSVSTTSFTSFDFLLRAYDPSSTGTLASEFGTAAYIAQAIFNSVSGDSPTSISNVQTNGDVGNIYLTSSDPNVGGVTFDFGDCFGSDPNCSNGNTDAGRLQSGEWVSWTLNFSALQDPFLDSPPVALHVRSFGVDNDDSGWYVPAIPEPETYAMLLAGLGLLAFVARRRRHRF
jgi:hypothetical protein